MNRRHLLKALGGFMVGSSLACFGGYQYASRIEPERPVVETVQIPLTDLKPALDGLKIVQLSDIHLHPFTKIELVNEIVNMVGTLQPDLIVLTGDYVLESAESIFELAPVLSGMNARHGIFAILGNHDLWTNAQVVRTGLEQAGIPVLVNAGAPITVGSEIIYLAGLDDGWSGNPDLRAALDKRPGNALTVLLMHEPDLVDTFALDGRVSLQLSGHTHGGQVRLPLVGPPILPPYGRKYDQGLYRVSHTWHYTNRGVGVINPPVRLNCPPEVSLITLTRA